MINLGLTYSVEEPKPIEITASKVFVSSDIQQIERQDEEGNQIQMYSFNLTSYDKDEYIILIAQQNSEIDELKEELSAAKILLGVE